MDQLEGRVAVVTGGGQGIGRALVERFAAEGMKVVLADVIESRVEAATAELRSNGLEVTGVVTDVTSLESVEALRDRTLETYGAVHVLCNNAGIGAGADGTIWQHHLNDWRWMFDVNVFGVINGIHAFLPTMLGQTERGQIVNTTSSNGGFTPIIASPIYAATKACVTTITECLWAQLRNEGANVDVSLLYPGTRTPGLLDTGIWRAGANRPERYDRPGAAPQEGKDSLALVRERLAQHGVEVTFAPLAEVADLCVEGILANTFWIAVPNDVQAGQIQARAASQIERTDPQYLLGGGDLAAALNRPKRT